MKNFIFSLPILFSIIALNVTSASAGHKGRVIVDQERIEDTIICKYIEGVTNFPDDTADIGEVLVDNLKYKNCFHILGYLYKVKKIIKKVNSKTNLDVTVVIIETYDSQYIVTYEYKHNK